jgi:hypothetical protein
MEVPDPPDGHGTRIPGSHTTVHENEVPAVVEESVTAVVEEPEQIVWVAMLTAATGTGFTPTLYATGTEVHPVAEAVIENATD